MRHSRTGLLENGVRPRPTYRTLAPRENHWPRALAEWAGRHRAADPTSAANGVHGGPHLVGRGSVVLDCSLDPLKVAGDADGSGRRRVLNPPRPGRAQRGEETLRSPASIPRHALATPDRFAGFCVWGFSQGHGNAQVDRGPLPRDGGCVPRLVKEAAPAKRRALCAGSHLHRPIRSQRWASTPRQRRSDPD